ncbi:MAG: M48 family metallopeptidase, partial [Gammaproteobacteria bacterium]
FRASVSALAKKGTRIPEPDFTSLDAARNLDELDDALARLAAAKPLARERVLRAVLECIRHDHQIELAEYELFRAIAATLGCPIPPAAAAIDE